MDVRPLRRDQAAIEDPFQLVLEADFLVRDRPTAASGNEQPDQRGWQAPDRTGKAVGPIRDAAAEQLGSTFPAESPGGTRLRQPREEPDGQSPSVRPRPCLATRTRSA